MQVPDLSVDEFCCASMIKGTGRGCRSAAEKKVSDIVI